MQSIIQQNDEKVGESLKASEEQLMIYESKHRFCATFYSKYGEQASESVQTHFEDLASKFAIDTAENKPTDHDLGHNTQAKLDKLMLDAEHQVRPEEKADEEDDAVTLGRGAKEASRRAFVRGMCCMRNGKSREGDGVDGGGEAGVGIECDAGRVGSDEDFMGDFEQGSGGWKEEWTRGGDEGDKLAFQAFMDGPASKHLPEAIEFGC
jgi:hypothetical protein